MLVLRFMRNSEYGPFFVIGKHNVKRAEPIYEAGVDENVKCPKPLLMTLSLVRFIDFW